MSGTNQNLVESANIVIGGSAAVLYPLRIRVRAAVEMMSYTGGSFDGLLQIGGSPQNYPNTRVKLVVSNPAQTYYLNRSPSVPTNFSVPLDYYVEIPVYGGATLTLSLERGDFVLYNDDQGGGTVRTTLAGFNGEFCQLDFTSTLDGDVVEKRASKGICRKWRFSGYEDNILSTKAEK